MSANALPLVGYGSSSDSDSDAGEQRQHETDGHNESGTEVKSQNLLLESGFGSSSSSSSDSEENPNVQTGPEVPVEPEVSVPDSATQQPGGRLPPPPPSVLFGSSVFANPFKEQAEERLSFLQKHVPLTAQARPSHIGGRGMCVAYRRDGRCRFGSSCKFAHDSDLQIPVGSQWGTEPGHQSNLSSSAQQGMAKEPQGDSGEVLEEVGRRKRKVGLSDSLTPPKRALKQYKAQRKKEGLSPLS